MQLVSRDMVLYVNGKRVGRKEAFQSDADANAYLEQVIAGLTPDQAKKAELRTEYRGTITDKARTANDGAGGAGAAAKGANDSNPLWDGKTFTSPKGSNSGPTETRLNVIVPANQTTDAQLQRASGGKWNPQQPTQAQTRAINALTRKGGRVVSPYSTTATPSNQPRTSGKLVGSNDALGFGTPAPATNSNRGGKYYRAGGTSTNDPRRAGAY